jgi:hypothetical protein
MYKIYQHQLKHWIIDEPFFWQTSAVISIISTFQYSDFHQIPDAVYVFQQMSFSLGSYFDYLVHQTHLPFPLFCSTFVKMFHTFSYSIALLPFFIFFRVVISAPYAIAAVMRRPNSASSNQPATHTDVQLPDIPRCCPGWPASNSMWHCGRSQKSTKREKGWHTGLRFIALLWCSATHWRRLLPSFGVTSVIWLVSVYRVNSLRPQHNTSTTDDADVSLTTIVLLSFFVAHSLLTTCMETFEMPQYQLHIQLCWMLKNVTF